jgi:AmmeMemoRadiSam system protein B
MAEMRPRLRQVDVSPLRRGDEELLCLSDPAGFTDDVVTVSLAAVPILQCFDGDHSLPDIQRRIEQTTSTVIPLEQLEKFVAELDRVLMLESPRFAALQTEVLEKFRIATIREPALAGRSYPAKAPEIRRLLARQFTAARASMNGTVRPSRPPAVLVIPHIDLRHGGAAYARAYVELQRAPAADIYLILGVAHAPAHHRYIGTKKHFRTPLGVLPTDHVFMDALAAKLPFDLYADEAAHRREHSIEFQVLCLQHALAGKREFLIAPILVGSFHDLREAGREPAVDANVAAFVRGLRNTIAESGKRVCVIASVDLSHVGDRFGDRFTINETVLKQIETDDHELLTAIEACDPAQLCQLIYAEKDRRRVDAWPAVYTMLRTLPVREGWLLHYGQHVETDANTVVTFASLAFE